MDNVESFLVGLFLGLVGGYFIYTARGRALARKGVRMAVAKGKPLAERVARKVL